MALFAAQARDVDIIITTALIPGKAAPKLILKEHVEAMKPGSVIVDLAGEAGGNCELTKPGEKVVHNGVTILGYTVSFVRSVLANSQDLPSRLPTQSSTLYSNNITKFLLSIGKDSKFHVNLEDEVVRGALITMDRQLLWPAPRPAAPPASAAPLKPVCSLSGIVLS